MSYTYKPHKIAPLWGMALAICLLVSCQQNTQSSEPFTLPGKGEHFDSVLVINELQSSNYTGLLTKSGELEDWFEIKNISPQAVSLSGWTAVAGKAHDEKPAQPCKNAKGEKADTLSQKPAYKLWHLPDTTLQPGACLLVYASKSKAQPAGHELHASFKLSSKGGRLMLVSPEGKMMADLAYGPLLPDQVWRRDEDGAYAKSFLPTPGRDNTQEASEAYARQMDRQRTDALKIWEVASKVDKSAYCWLELKNTSADTLALGQYALTDKPDKPDKWKLPDMPLLPGQMVTVQLAGKKAKRELQARFKLDESESVILTRNNKFVDGACAKLTYFGTSIGRQEGQAGFRYLGTPSPGQENTGRGMKFIAQRPTFLQQPGAHNKVARMPICLDTHGHTVHYTLDGSTPTTASPIYRDSIVITDNAVIRAFAEGDSTSLPSTVATATFILKETHTLPIVSIAIRPSDLYDYATGIYVEGPHAEPEHPHKGANYWKPWDKKAHVAFNDGREGFETDCDLAIFGGFSRASDKKSFKVKFQNKYGASDVAYDYFGRGEPVKLKSFVLRSGSQDDIGVMVRDEFFTSLMAQQCPTLLVQDYRPVALYVNAKYFGLYYIREKVDKHFVARHLNVSPDSTSIIMSRYLELGSMDHFNALRNYVRTHDMTSRADYDYMDQHVDLLGLVDHTLGEMYAGNTDLGNVRIVRSTDSRGDRKWHMVYYDLDATWFDHRGASTYLNGSSPICLHYLLVERLLRNKDFRKLFLQRTAHHMRHTFSTANTQRVFDALIADIRDEMKLNCQRWPKLSYERWQKNVENFRKKFQTKHTDLMEDLRQTLHITPEEEKEFFKKK